MLKHTKQLLVSFVSVIMCLSLFHGNTWAAEDELSVLQDSGNGFETEAEPCEFMEMQNLLSQESEDILKAQEVKSGSCGNNLTWMLDDAGTLTISGKGEMKDYAADGAWYDYKNSIKKIVIKPGVTSIGQYAFSLCFYVTEVSIPDTVKSIGLQAFWSDSRLTELTIPGSVTEIGESAFGSCSGLTKVMIQEGVKTIGWKAFSECTSLTDIIIPASVTDVGKDAFKRTPWLDNQGDFVIINGILVAYRGAGADARVPSSVEKIGHGAFAGTDVVSVIIPEGVTSLGGYAFSNCRKLTSLSLPDSITSLGWYTFEYCISLPEINLPKNIDVISFGTFAHCYRLKHLVIPEKVHSILREALYDCTDLEDIMIPASVVNIENAALTISDTVIIGYSNTEAERYAKAEGYTFRSLGVLTQSLSSAKITVADQTFTGKALTPAVKVTLDGILLQEGTDYKVTYKDNKNTGKATVTVKGTGNYSGTKTKSFKIKKAANPLKIKDLSKTYKQKELAKANTFKIGVSKAQGKVTYTLDKKAKKAGIKVTSKGKVTVPKKCKKGTYKITVKAAGNDNYKAGSKTVKVIVK